MGISAEEAIGIIVSLLTDEQKQLLSIFHNERCILTVEEQLGALYIKKYPRYNALRTKVEALKIINENDLNFSMIKNKKKFIEELSEISAYGITKKTKENNTVAKNAISKSSNNVSQVNFTQDKTRQGLSSYSVEFDKDKDGNETDDKLLQQVINSNRDTQLKLIEHESKKEAVLNPDAGSISTSIKESVGEPENEPYMSSITLGTNRNLTVAKSDSISVGNSDSTTKGDKDNTQTTFNTAESLTAMQDFRFKDVISTILFSFSILFRDVKRCL